MNLEQWKSHVDVFHTSNLSKRAYAKKHHLVYHQLLYYINKFNEQERESETFIPVAIKEEQKISLPSSQLLSAGECLGILELPNGSRLYIHSRDMLALLPGLFSQ